MQQSPNPIPKRRLGKEILMPEPESRIATNDASPAQPRRERGTSAREVICFLLEL